MVKEKKLLFIINPKAGKTAIKNKMNDILNIFCNGGYRVEVYITHKEQDVDNEFIVEHAEEFDLVVCAGGDGTLDNTVSGIMRLERKLQRRIHMGYIPCGSTNDYAKSLQLSLDPVQAAEDIVNGQLAHVDVGRLENDFFIYVAAFGIFTDISYTTSQSLKNALGHAAYVIEASKSVFSVKSYKLKAWFDDELVEGEFIYGHITNSLSIGGFKNVGVKNMSFCDGKFESILVRKPKNPADLNKIVSGLLSDKMKDEYIVFKESSRVVIKCEEEIPWTLDGEYGGRFKTTRIINIQKGLSIMVKNKKLISG